MKMSTWNTYKDIELTDKPETNITLPANFSANSDMGSLFSAEVFIAANAEWVSARVKEVMPEMMKRLFEQQQKRKTVPIRVDVHIRDNGEHFDEDRHHILRVSLMCQQPKDDQEPAYPKLKPAQAKRLFDMLTQGGESAYIVVDLEHGHYVKHQLNYGVNSDHTFEPTGINNQFYSTTAEEAIVTAYQHLMNFLFTSENHEVTNAHMTFFDFKDIHGMALKIIAEDKPSVPKLKAKLPKSARNNG